MFTSVIYNNQLGNTPARVNRATGQLQVNPRIWDYLPADYKDYILYHESGHLVLNTADEAAANGYAIENYLQIGELTDQEAARRIVVLSEITNPEDTKAFTQHPDGEQYSNFGIAAIGSAISGIFQTLPALGLGSKSRINEAQQIAAAQASAATASAAATTKIIIVAGFILITILVLYFALKK